MSRRKSENRYFRLGWFSVGVIGALTFALAIYIKLGHSLIITPVHIFIFTLLWAMPPVLFLFSAFKSGEIFFRSYFYKRRESPINFWFSVLFYLLMVAAPIFIIFISLSTDHFTSGKLYRLGAPTPGIQR
jgi:magnesium-transporting ATPase (P-type)